MKKDESINSKQNVLAILPVLGQPRHAKRIEMLKEAGFQVEGAAFERDYLVGRLPDCPIERLGEVVPRQYVRRLSKLVKSIRAIRRLIKRNSVVYAFGADMACLALVAGAGLGRPIVLETGDIREIQTRAGWKGAVVRFLDKHLLDKYSILVATAPAFIDEYYRQWLHVTVPALVIENKLERSFVESTDLTAPPLEGTPLVDRPLKIGYFGGLRCAWSWGALEELAKAFPRDIEIIFAGHPFDPPDLPERAAEYPNMQFLGRYDSPQDLPRLYGLIDMSWACYRPISPKDWNLRWARPNRFYESCLFKKPLIVRAGCSYSSVVEQYRIGKSLDATGAKEVVDSMAGIRPEDFQQWERNMASLPSNVYMYTSEGKDLRGAIGAVADKS